MVDDSIYRDFYAAADWVNATWTHWQPLLESEFAMRVYAASAAFVIVAGSLVRAYLIKRDLIQLLNTKRNKGIPGPLPKDADKIERRRHRLMERTNHKAREFGSAFVKLILLGVLVPCFFFLVFLLQYHWFDPAGIGFLTASDKQPVSQTQFVQALFFLVDQLSHSLLLDFPDVFAVDMAPVTNNPSNYTFSGIVLLFRTIVGGFGLFVLNSVWQSAVVLIRLRAGDKKDIEKLQHTTA